MLPNIFAIAVLVLVFAVTLYLANNDYFQTLMGFLFALLIHELILRWLINLLHLPRITVSLLSLWKEAVLLVLVIVAVKRIRRNIGHIIRIIDRRNIILGTILIVWGIVLVFVSPNRIAGVAAFRDYFEPMLVLGLIIAAHPKELRLRRSLNVWLAFGVGMALLGIWQAVSWGPAQYVQYGFGEPRIEAGIPYVSIGGQWILRPASTVTGPNELGFHMILLSILAFKFLVLENKNTILGIFLIVVFGACLFFTRSRSDLIAYGITIIIIVVSSTRRIESLFHRNPFIGLSLLVIGILLIGGLLYTTGMVDFVLRTIQNMRAEYHVIDIREAIEFLAVNPGGVGMGLAGPRIGAFFPESPAFHAEGSLFQIALDMGIFGLVLWLTFIFSLMSTIYRRTTSNNNDFRHALQTTAVIGWIGALIVFIILPLMQSLTLMGWMWFLLGVALCQESPTLDKNPTYDELGKNAF